MNALAQVFIMYLNYLHFIFEEEKSNEINLNFEENTTKILNLVNLINKKIENKEEILLSSEETDLILKGLDSTIFWLEKYKNDNNSGTKELGKDNIHKNYNKIMKFKPNQYGKGSKIGADKAIKK